MASRAPAAGQSTGRNRSALIAAGRRGEGGRARGLVAGTGGVEDVEESADYPIACRHAKGKGAEDGEQEQGRYQKCHHRCYLVPMHRAASPDV